MPRGRQPEGETALSNAERQARWRAKHQAPAPSVVIRTRRPVDRRSRVQRWRDAVTELVNIQSDCAEWLDALPEAFGERRPRKRFRPSSIWTSTRSRRWNRHADMAATEFNRAHGIPMMLGETVGLKGRASRAGEPVSALDPAALTQRRAVMPFRAGWVGRSGVSFLLCARSVFSTLRRHWM
jgi:hypothetical protein